MTLGTDGVRCPLCHASQGTAVASLVYDEIWRRLQTDWGASFSKEVKRGHTPAPKTTVYRCVQCGLDYFSPSVPGNSDFYAELMRSVAYERDRWEFGVVAAMMAPRTRLVDFGSGDGAFLKTVAKRCDRAVAVDYNPDAIAALRAVGLEAYDQTFEEFAAREEAAFDVACAFQLLEHLDRVDTLVEPMKRCVRPGGRVFLSVPNRERYSAELGSPLDSPPHHASRWSSRQLAVLGRRFEMTLDAVHFAPLAYQEAIAWCMGPLESVLPTQTGSPSRRVARGLIRRALIGSRRYEFATRRGLFAQRGLHGHTMLAEFRVANG